jgi:hypothetical protein
MSRGDDHRKVTPLSPRIPLVEDNDLTRWAHERAQCISHQCNCGLPKIKDKK